MKNFTRDPNCLGYIVLYGTSSQVHLTVDQVDKELEKNMLRTYQLSRPTGLRAVSRAAKHIENSSIHKTARTVANNDIKKIIAIFYEELNVSSQTIDFHHETTGVYNKVEGSFSATGPDAKEFSSLFVHYSKFVTGDDIRQMARKVVENASGISLRGGTYVDDAGGVYFIPRKKIDEMELLKHVLENLEIGYVKAFCVTNGKSERADMFDSAVIYFRKQIKSIQEGAERVTSRISSLEKYKAQLTEIKAKMSVYARLTGRRKNQQMVQFIYEVDQHENIISEKIERLEMEKEKEKKNSSE